MQLNSKTRNGRGAVRDLPNRFEKLAMDLDPDVVQEDPGAEGETLPNPKTIFLDDQSESIIVQERQPRRRLRRGDQSVSRVRAWLRLLLRAALSRVPRLFGRARI